MTLPTSAVITGIDNLQVLDQAIEAARTLKPMTKEEIAALLGRTREAAAKGQFELYKISQHFDGTARTRSGSAKQRGCRRFAVEHTPGAADHGQIKPSVRRRALLKLFAPVGGTGTYRGGSFTSDLAYVLENYVKSFSSRLAQIHLATLLAGLALPHLVPLEDLPIHCSAHR